MTSRRRINELRRIAGRLRTATINFGVKDKAEGDGGLSVFENAPMEPFPMLSVLIGESMREAFGNIFNDLPSYQMVAPDGPSELEPYTGTLNVYVFPTVELKALKRAILQFFKKWENLGFEFEYGRKLEQSGMYPEYRVWRVEVNKNPMEGDERSQSLLALNVTNDNAAVLMDILRLSAGRMSGLFREPHVGEVELEVMIGLVDDAIKKQLWKGKSRETHRHFDRVDGELQLRLLDIGLTEGKLQRYLLKLQEMLGEGKRRGYQTFYWSQ